jgi:hypothetical protein
MNMYYIIVEYHKDIPAARQWLSRAHDLVTANLTSERDAGRRQEYLKLQETIESIMKKEK